MQQSGLNNIIFEKIIKFKHFDIMITITQFFNIVLKIHLTYETCYVQC